MWGLGLFELTRIAFSKKKLYFFQKYISSYILYYSCLMKIYKFSRRNSLKSASLYRGGLVDAAVVGLVDAAVV
jgi:hypothetical protein